MWRDPPLHALSSRSWWWQSDQDATTFSWVFLFGGFVNILVVPCFLANKFHVCFILIVTTSELLVRQSIRTSNALPTLLKNSQRMTFLLALFHKTFCDARQSERFGSSLPPFCQINDFAGIADTPCRRPLFAPNFSEVTSLPAWVGSKVLATTTELLCFFGSPPLFSVCLNAHSQVCNHHFDHRSTQVEAHVHKHFLLDIRSLWRRRTRSRPHCLFHWILVSFLDRVSFHTYLLESTDLLLSIVRNLHCFFSIYP